MINILRKLIAGLQPTDYPEAAGSLFMVAVFVFLLYAIAAPHPRIIGFSVGLVVWPVYQFVSILAEHAVLRGISAVKNRKDEDIALAIFLALILLSLAGLFSYSAWFFLVLLAQIIPLPFNPPSERNAEAGCAMAVFSTLVLILILILVMSGLDEWLSKPFEMSLVEGGFKSLPGMLIIGIGYYLLSAGVAVLMQPLMRGAALK